MTITPIYAALLGLIYVALSANVIRTRRGRSVSLGDGGDQLLMRRIRGHGNFAEYVPIALILLAFLEVGGANAILVHILNALLVLGRLMHGFALSSLTLRPICRTGGMVLTFGVIIVAALGGLGLSVVAGGG